MQAGTGRGNRAAWVRSLDLSPIRFEPNFWGKYQDQGGSSFTVIGREAMDTGSVCEWTLSRRVLTFLHERRRDCPTTQTTAQQA